MKNPIGLIVDGLQGFCSMASDPTAYPLTPRVASSGDLVLDRRREWALAATAEGFHRGAAEIYEQILERAPWWAVAWFELGDAREQMGDRPGAIAAFEAAAARDGQGLLAADLRLAALGAGETPAAPSAAYVTGLFDQYADNFDRHLVEALEYRGPAILNDALRRVCVALGRPVHFDLAYDLGCGTGLMGLEIKHCCAAIDGVDLSRGMIEAARKTGVYRGLEAGEIVQWLDSRSEAQAALVIAADVFVYLGDLAPVFAASARALAAGGLFVFSVQKGDADFSVGADMRYAHSAENLRRLAAAHGFRLHALEEVSTRKDRGAPVPGLAVVMGKD